MAAAIQASSRLLKVSPVLSQARSSPKSTLPSSQAFGHPLRFCLQPPAPRRMFDLFKGKARASAATFEGKTLHDFTVQDIDGNTVDLGTFKGKVALIVNVASQCGLTNTNYKELTALYEKYKDQGFVVLAFPSNQFGSQEPGSNDQIKEFACSRYKATFPMFAKVDVNGPSAAPVYQFLRSQKGGLMGDSIKWNFGKFLVDKDGKVFERYAPTTPPSSIEADIKKLL